LTGSLPKFVALRYYARVIRHTILRGFRRELSVFAVAAVVGDPIALLVQRKPNDELQVNLSASYALRHSSRKA
jgi:hypothetical protein